MKQLLCMSCCCMLLGSCNEGTQSAQSDVVATDTTAVPVSATTINGCYTMNIGRDTALLRIDANGIFVKGTLMYKRFEKDSNNGTFEATIDKQVIKGWYRFNSEGVISVRQVYFRIYGDKIAEGYGEMDMRKDTAFFKYPTTVSYEEHHPYQKVNCSDNFPKLATSN